MSFFAFLQIALALNGQLLLGVEAGPSIQTITESEATLTESYQAMVLPNAGLDLTYDFQNKYRIQLRSGFSQKGAKLNQDLGDTVKTRLLATYIYVNAGLAYQVVKSSFGCVLIGADFDLGFLNRGRFDWELKNGKIVDGILVKGFFANPYLGLNIYAAYEYQLGNGLILGFQPKINLGLNDAFNTQFFKPRFFGFSPNLRISIPIAFKEK